MRSPLRRRGPSVVDAANADAAPAPSPEAPGPLASAASASSSSSEPSTLSESTAVLHLPPPRTPLRSHVGANAALLAAARRRREEEEEENAAMNVDDRGEEEEEDDDQTISPHVDAVAAALLERFRAVADKRVSEAAVLLVG